MIGREEQVVKSKKLFENNKNKILELENINTYLGHKSINLSLYKGEIFLRKFVLLDKAMTISLHKSISE